MLHTISANVVFVGYYPVGLRVNVDPPDLGKKDFRSWSIVIERQPDDSRAKDSSSVRKLTIPFLAGQVGLVNFVRDQAKMTLDEFWLPGQYTVELQAPHPYPKLLTSFTVGWVTTVANHSKIRVVADGQVIGSGETLDFGYTLAGFDIEVPESGFIHIRRPKHYNFQQGSVSLF